MPPEKTLTSANAVKTNKVTSSNPSSAYWSFAETSMPR